MLSHEEVGMVCLCILAWYIYKATVGCPTRRIPGPRGLPIVGSLLTIDWPAVHLQLAEWQSKYGPVMKISLMGQDIVVISSAEAAKEALVSRGTDFAGRPPTWRMERACFFEGIITGKFTPSLIEKKKLMLHHMKVGHRDGHDQLERIIMEEMVYFLDQMASYKAQPVDAKLETANFISNTLITLVYGERYPYHHPAFKDLLQLSQGLTEIVSVDSPGKPVDMFPWLRFTGMFGEGMNNLRRLESLRDTILVERIKRERASFNPSSRRGIIDDLLSKSLEPSDVKSRVVWNDEQIVAYLLGIFGGGISSSVNTMQGAYLVLLKHPEVQTQIQQEIDSIIGNSEPSIKHRDKMPYTEAFVFELLRYTTIAPLLLRMTLNDTSVGGYFVPGKTKVLINCWDIQHDDKVYPEPFEFRPERFLDQHGRIHDHDHPSRAHFIAFGAGRRSCPGGQLAMARVFLLVVSLLQRFTLKEDEARPAPDPDPRTYKFSIVLDVPKCFFIALPRK